MSGLTDPEIKMAAEIATEIARTRGKAFDRKATALAFCRAAQADADFRAKLAEVHRRLIARRATDIPRKMLAPIAPLFRDLEREAEGVLSRS
jgi:hypothetical protein